MEKNYNVKGKRELDLLSASYADISKIKKEIGWEPKVKIDEGIKKILVAAQGTID